jgi:purine-cytosine permease-like protein
MTRSPHPPALQGRSAPGGIEQRSIDFVPEAERHGKVSHQGPFWFLSNFHFFSLAIGFVGPSLGLSLGYTILAGILGIAIGTVFMAFHASQGPEMGLPQMIQSRAQFGYRGVIVPLLATFVSLVSYNVVAAILVAQGLNGLWAFNRTGAAVGISVIAAVLAIWGHDWLHRAFAILFWISVPLFILLTLGILGGHAGGASAGSGGFGWVAFLTQLASAASFNVTAAPYVSDYSRYLPSSTPRAVIIAQVFLGAAVSAIWLIAVGAWLATHMGQADALVALKTSGDHLAAGLGAVLAAVSIMALVATIGMNAYSAMLTLVTVIDSIRSVRPTVGWRIGGILALFALWVLTAVSLGGDAVVYVNGMLVMMLYFLMPWTAVNLIDYFLIRKGVYSISDLFTPNGVYGAWGARGLFAYGAGLLASVPFFVVPKVYTGPVAERLGGVDVGWLVSLLVAASLYFLLSFKRGASGVPAKQRGEGPAEAVRIP